MNTQTFLAMMFGISKVFHSFTGPWVSEGFRDQSPGGLLAAKRIPQLYGLIGCAKKFFHAKHLFAGGLSKEVQVECTKMSVLILEASDLLLDRMVERCRDLADVTSHHELAVMARHFDDTAGDFKDIFGEDYVRFRDSWNELGTKLDELARRFPYLKNLHPDRDWIDAVLADVTLSRLN